VTFLRVFLAHSASFGCAGFGLGEVQVMTLIALSWFGRATLKQGAGLAEGRLKVCDKRFLVSTGLDGDGLSLWTGDFGWLAIPG
jgi:hypothetical protein